MEGFIESDFIRIKNYSPSLSSRVNKKINIFEIEEIEGDECTLKLYKSKVNLSDLEPIEINGVDDKDIYYDPIIAGSFIRPGDEPPTHHLDKSYYLDHFERCFYKENSFKKLVAEKNLKYVHELQHFFSEMFNKPLELKIKDF